LFCRALTVVWCCQDFRRRFAERRISASAGGKRTLHQGYLDEPKRRDGATVALTAGQAPFASILSCSDSRVPPELVFDAKLGDLFVVRNAGNIVAAAVLGTLEYGYDVLGVRLIVVLGHEKCGAVSATYDALRDKKPLGPNLDVLQRAIAPGIAGVVTAHGSATQGGVLHAAVLANAKAQAAKLLDSPVLGPAIRKGACKVVAAEYGFVAGRVDFLT